MSNKASYNNLVFFNSLGQIFNLDEIFCAIKNYISLHPKSRYEIIIGSDSKANKDVLFVTSLVIRRVGNGGVFFYTKLREDKTYTLRERIWKEAMLSITFAQEIRGSLKEMLEEEMFWNEQIVFKHIHLDIGHNGKTRDLIDGVTGMVKGFGFVPVIKPFSYGASKVADLYT